MLPEARVSSSQDDAEELKSTYDQLIQDKKPLPQGPTEKENPTMSHPHTRKNHVPHAKSHGWKACSEQGIGAATRLENEFTSPTKRPPHAHSMLHAIPTKTNPQERTLSDLRSSHKTGRTVRRNWTPCKHKGYPLVSPSLNRPQETPRRPKTFRSPAKADHPPHPGTH